MNIEISLHDRPYNVCSWGDCSVGSFSSCPVESSSSSSSSCLTVGGPAASQPCVFPFTVGGVTYSSCKTDGTVQTSCLTTSFWGMKITTCRTEGLSEPWCSTSTTADGTHVSDQGNYGQCPDTCGTCVAVSGPAQGRLCVFPFSWAGTTWSECADWSYGGAHQGEFWCSTKYVAGEVVMLTMVLTLLF